MKTLDTLIALAAVIVCVILMSFSWLRYRELNARKAKLLHELSIATTRGIKKAEQVAVQSVRDLELEKRGHVAEGKPAKVNYF